MCRSRAQPVIDENEPSVAGNSRSTDERQDSYRKEDEIKIRVSGRHGWNFYELGTVLLFLIAFSLLCGSSRADPEPCVLTIDGIHDDCPFTKEQALFVEHGHPLTMFCYREWSSEKRPFSRDRQVSDFIILLNNEIVQPLTDFGRDEVQLYLDTLPPSTNTFECRLKIPNDTRGDTELIYRSTITIGFKPKMPDDFKCVPYNQEKLVCTWDPEPNTVPTRFSLRKKWSSLIICPASQAGSKIPPNSCVWDTSMDPPYDPTRTMNEFQLDGENTLGKNSFEIVDLSYWEHAIPPQPDKLLVLNITDSSALLRWSVLGLRPNFLIPGLHHRVSYQAQSNSRKTWHTIDITDEKREAEKFLVLTDLEFADTAYKVRVSMKNSWAVGEDKWSQPAETIFKTAVSRQFSHTVKYHKQKPFAEDAFRPPKPKTVGVDRIGSDSAEVRWELPYSGRIDIVKGFNIYYCPAPLSQQCTDPTIKTFLKGDQHLTVGTVRDLRPDTTYKLTVTVLSENGEEGLHSAPSYFTTTKAAPDLSSIEKTIRAAIEQSSSGMKDYVKDLMKQYKQNEIDELRSQINDSVAQVSNLGLTITALNAKLDSLSESTKQRDEALDRKLEEIGDLKSEITNAVTQVSNLMLSLSDSSKQRDEALGDKLGGIDELNARINDSVTEVSNLGQTISAYKVELVSLSEENCQVRGNLTQCERDLADSFGKPPNW